MMVHILYNFRDGPWGGGNQFLKNLKSELAGRNCYSDRLKNADCVLVNSKDNLSKAILLSLFSKKKLVHRLDGIFHHHRGKSWKRLDRLLVYLADNLFDGAVFQSHWCLEEARKLGFKSKVPYEVIHNACDTSIFYPSGKKERNDKVRIVIVSWSKNQNKGFSFYDYLDNNLDFSRYDVTFVGNSPIAFNNIRILPPLDSHGIAEQFRKSNIYLTAVQKEACSNAIIEAKACGLPVVALDSGSNKEVVGIFGEVFQSESDMIHKIDKVVVDLDNYKKWRGSVETFRAYADFITHKTKRRRRSLLRAIWALAILFAFKIKK